MKKTVELTNVDRILKMKIIFFNERYFVIYSTFIFFLCFSFIFTLNSSVLYESLKCSTNE